MKKEDFFACLEKASEAFNKSVQEAAAEEREEDEFARQLQEEELAEQVAKELGLL